MISPGPTHSGSPFVGRSREIGLLTHLLEEGLEGRLGLIRVAGSSGSGRRRLIAEALNRGPDVEWIHLAPGGVEPDLKRWVRTELIDLLDTYPEVPLPSWALSVLEPWAPSLAARCAVPVLARERVPSDDRATVIGRAIGALLLALTGRTCVIVDVGLWPEDSEVSRTLTALIRALEEPGTVMIAASTSEGLATDPATERTLLLEPLDREAVSELARRWMPDNTTDGLASWLARVTSGHAFFIHETVRWLEELGHVRVHEDERRIDLLSPIERWPYPLHLEAVMETRYRRLPPSSARLLELIAKEDGRLEVETLRARWGDDESFEESIAWLRRRDFLRDRSTRRPVALASPLWHSFARGNVFALPARSEPVFLPDAPLARMMDRVEELLVRPGEPEAFSRDVADIARRLRGRRGPAWDGVRGRLAVVAGRLRRSQSNTNGALRWVRWGLAWTSSDLHPGLRRTLRALAADCLERDGDPERASGWRREALVESEASGQHLAATRLKAVLAEEGRRLGDLHPPSLEDTLLDRGLDRHARLFAFTRIAALLDARDLLSARHALETSAPESKDALSAWLTELESGSVTACLDPAAMPRGWGWGLDAGTWHGALERLANRMHEIASGAELPRSQVFTESHGFLVLAADALQCRIATLRATVPASTSNDLLGDLLAQSAALLGRLNAPLRLREQAERLLDTDAAHHPRFPELFGRHLVRAATEAAPPPADGVRLTCTGRPRVERGRVWPAALWPEWCAELWVSAVSAALLDETLDGIALLARMRSRGPLPHGDVHVLIEMANELFRGPERWAGGLVFRHGNIGIDWTGISCDARSALEDFAAADTERDSTRSRALYARGLDRIEGAYFPGFEFPEAARARTMLEAGVHRALDACLAARSISADQFNRWLEGPMRSGRALEGAAQFMESLGHSHRALALRRASS